MQKWPNFQLYMFGPYVSKENIKIDPVSLYKLKYISVQH